MADTDWDLNKYFWPKDRVERWWTQGWDWESLKKRPCPHGDFSGKNYSDYYDRLITFADPRPGKNRQPIRESDYWRARSVETGGSVAWLTEFPKGSGNFWTPYHLPLFDRDAQLLSPKYQSFERFKRFHACQLSRDLMEGFRECDKFIDSLKNQTWESYDLEALISGLKARMRSKFTGQPLRPEGDWRAPLSGIVIPPNTQLFLSDDDYEVDFSDAMFSSQTNFSDSMSSTRTLSIANFNNTSFGSYADFTDIELRRNTAFTGAWFGEHSSFSNATINGEFENTQFAGTVIFGCCRFRNCANFRHAIISDSYFNEALFERGADFSDAIFQKTAGFRNAKFQGTANFDRTIFLNGISISHTMDISNETTVFSSEEKVFYPTADNPRNTERSAGERVSYAFRDISFKGAKFWGDANFSNRIFSLPVDFTDARFYCAVILHGATLHQSTKFTASNKAFFPGPGGKPQVEMVVGETQMQLQVAALEEWNARRKELTTARTKAKWTRRLNTIRQLVPWSVTEQSTDDWTKRCQEFEQAYRRAKILMQEQGARNEEQFFYTLEIKSRMQRLDVSCAEKFFARLYGFASNYGQSIARPFFGALCFWPVFIAILLYLLTWKFQPNIGWSDSIGYSAHYVIRNIVPGLNLRDVLQSCPPLYCYQSLYDQWINHFISDWWGTRTVFYLISTLYSAGSLTLWFLFALALRRRFQIG